MKYKALAEARTTPESHPVRGAWVEIRPPLFVVAGLSSHPVRGAWVEIPHIPQSNENEEVAPREGCVG